MHKHREPRCEWQAIVSLDVEGEYRDGVSGGCVEGVWGVWHPGWRGVGLTPAGEAGIDPAVTERREPERADRICESGVPEIKGAGGGVREEEESRREEEYISIAIVLCG